MSYCLAHPSSSMVFAISAAMALRARWSDSARFAMRSQSFLYSASFAQTSGIMFERGMEHPGFVSLHETVGQSDQVRQAHADCVYLFVILRKLIGAHPWLFCVCRHLVGDTAEGGDDVAHPASSPPKGNPTRLAILTGAKLCAISSLRLFFLNAKTFVCNFRFLKTTPIGCGRLQPPDHPRRDFSDLFHVPIFLQATA